MPPEYGIPLSVETADGTTTYRYAGAGGPDLVLTAVRREPRTVTLSPVGDAGAATVDSPAALAQIVDIVLGDANRVELVCGADERVLLRAAARAGLRQEGVLRAGLRGQDAVVMARLAADRDLVSSEAFSHVLNSTLPRKRQIGQGLIRDDAGRVLLCELTYKRYWDLPGGIVDPDEPPAVTVEREIREELDVAARVGRLAAVSWLPRWLGWDDAMLFVFETALPDELRGAQLLPREIKAVHWVHPDELDAHVAPYTAAVTRAAIAALADGTGTVYLENGRPPARDA